MNENVDGWEWPHEGEPKTWGGGVDKQEKKLSETKLNEYDVCR